MTKRRSLSVKLTYFFLILVLSVLIATGLGTFLNQTSIYMKQNEQRLKNIVEYLAQLTLIDGDEFVAYQQIMLEYGDEIMVPFDFDGDYHHAKLKFYEAFNEVYPGKAPGIDVLYTDMPENLKILYGVYKHEYWLHIFEIARDSFEIDYCYYVVPTGEGLHVYYVIDAVREEKEVDGEKYILLNYEVDQPQEIHQHMWNAWNSGEYVPGFDMTNNEYGINLVYCLPLIINDQKMGLVCADVSFEKVNRNIVYITLKHVVGIGIVVVIICAIISWLVGSRYIKRLIKLKDEISEFSDNKDPDISYKIIQDIKGNDEIYDLAKQTSMMIQEIGAYMQSLVSKNKDLAEAQRRLTEANELANRDTLTGIRNKTAYDNEVRKIDDKIINERFRKFGIAMVDLNNLKKINDSFGHEKGNVAIKKVCNMICRKFAHSPVFRVGGDEFVVIIENDDYEKAETLVTELQQEIDAIYGKQTLEPWERVSAAIGWALYDPVFDADVDSVFKKADQQMNKKKKAMKAGMI